MSEVSSKLQIKAGEGLIEFNVSETLIFFLNILIKKILKKVIKLN
jgi:hypothetical protein